MSPDQIATPRGGAQAGLTPTSVSPAEPATPGPSIAEATLANGLEIVVIPDHRAPVVTHMVWYRNGSADDPVGKSGIAHFLEHLMFKGTKNHPRANSPESWPNSAARRTPSRRTTTRPISSASPRSTSAR